MVEVSTCVINTEFIVGAGGPGTTVPRGVEIGPFAFGGSTRMMIFQKDRVVLEDWAVNAVQHQNGPNPTSLGA